MMNQGSALRAELNERRARFPLGLGFPAKVHQSKCCGYAPKLEMLKFLRVSFGTCLHKTACAHAHDSVNGSHRNSTLKLLLSCS